MSDDDLDNVIHLFGKRPTGAAEQGQPQLDKLQEIFVMWQAQFMHYGQTLTNPDTASSLHAAADMFGRILDGACNHEVITSEQRDQLKGIVHTAHAAADEWTS
ncbi:hypothetical protein JBE04_01820 [Streptomyces sp. PRKS01-29]|nr:hypothetical protein [Streptomyces sabulosicollis]MBI0293265.1 hypothetical protein [Streptomyces sabulosicollis]